MANPPSPRPPPSQPSAPIRIDGAEEDETLSSSAYLTHQELLTRRSRRFKQLAQIFRAHYWTLMEELKVKHKEYYWIYGKSPYKEDEKNKKRKRDFNDDKENFEWNAKSGINGVGGEVEAEEREEEGVRKCSGSGCKAKPMPLTSFCYTHILLDSKQKLYKGCAYVVKSAQGRPVLCGKPALISTVPSLCPMHFQKAERHLARALKKAGLGVSSPSKLAPKLHVIVTEFVRQIQTKRRAALKENISEDHIKEEKISQGS
ncbi:hypothetical protein OIU74_018689 [Salix koriyanagi]|uniref:KANL2-like probable zinc-finger domain-containing protein n=1 Tax=Salix koriyanagi TaxID=2511006 RepID=A0A9Q1AIH7_9ROSI|nr:hypothetical protein OIU74_018689 [Salix koriyanagi]